MLVRRLKMSSHYLFVARENELFRLNHLYQSPAFQMAIIYGRDDALVKLL